MKSLNKRHLQKRYANIAIIIGLAFFGITFFTTVLANVVFTDNPCLGLWSSGTSEHLIP
jgi:hypothetical protein